MSRYLSSKYHKLFAVVFIFAVVAIYILALMPQSSAPSFSWSDKANHLFAFMVLAIFLRLGFRISYWSSLLLLIGYGVFIEISQYFTADRSAEWADVVADTIGSFIGLAIYKYTNKAIQ